MYSCFFFVQPDDGRNWPKPVAKQTSNKKKTTRFVATGLLQGIEDFVHCIHTPKGMSNIKRKPSVIHNELVHQFLYSKQAVMSRPH
jgi:hypothetical protein